MVARDTTRAGAALNQPEKLSDVAEFAGKTVEGERAQRRCCLLIKGFEEKGIELLHQSHAILKTPKVSFSP
jgi:hypothetical protein